MCRLSRNLGASTSWNTQGLSMSVMGLLYLYQWPLCLKVKVKVRPFHYRPGQTQSFPEGWGSRISRQSAHEGAKVVSPTHRPPLTPQEILPVLISVRGWVDPKAIVRPEGLCQWRIPVTPLGIELATFRFVAPPRAQPRCLLTPITEWLNASRRMILISCLRVKWNHWA